MRRTDGWFPRLVAVIDGHARLPHAWGESDCLCRVADGYLAMTGSDPAAPYRGRYTSYAEGAALLAADGFAEPVDYVRSLCPEIHPSEAGDGDIGAMLGDDGTLAFGLICRRLLYVATPAGNGRFPRLRAQRAFRI